MRHRRKKYDREILICCMQKLANDLGKTPSAKEMNNAKGFPDSKTYILEFGSWNNALKEASLSLNKLRKYADEELIQLLKILASRLSKSPSYRQMEKAIDFPDASVFSRRFDSWSNALVRAGLKPNKARRYSDMHLIKLLRRLAKKLGKSPSHEQMNSQPGYPCGNSFRDRFETWNKALEKAGLEKNNPFVSKKIS